MKRAGNRRGVAIIEFTMVGIAVIFVTASIIEMSIESWRYASMMYAIQVADRYACQHGRTCGKNGNTCLIKVENVANMISTQAPSLDASQLNITLTTQSATVNCHPLNTCFTNTDQFPKSADNGVGLPITITATYPMISACPVACFGSSTPAETSVTLGANTEQLIVF